MKFEQWNEIAELAGTVAVVASLIFVGLQLQQTRQQMELEGKIALTEMNSTHVANVIESDDAIIQNIDIWLRGNAGEELSRADQEIHARLVHMANDKAYYDVLALRRMESEDEANLAAAVFAGFLHENPGAKRVWRDREQWLGRYRRMVEPEERTTSSWVDLIESHIAIFEEEAR